MTRLLQKVFHWLFFLHVVVFWFRYSCFPSKGHWFGPVPTFKQVRLFPTDFITSAINTPATAPRQLQLSVTAWFSSCSRVKCHSLLLLSVPVCWFILFSLFRTVFFSATLWDFMMKSDLEIKCIIIIIIIIYVCFPTGGFLLDFWLYVTIDFTLVFVSDT